MLISKEWLSEFVAFPKKLSNANPVTFKVLKNFDTSPSPCIQTLDEANPMKMLLMISVREIEPRDGHPRLRQRFQNLERIACGTYCVNHFCASHKLSFPIRLSLQFNWLRASVPACVVIINKPASVICPNGHYSHHH